MSPFLAEFIGTMFIILLGNGVVANVLLAKSKGQNGGWIVITFGWAIAVFVGVYSSATVSGAHLNPAISIALAALGKFEWANVPMYLLAQLSGAMTGSLLMWLAYKKHFDEVHKIRYGTSAPKEAADIVSLRVTVMGRMKKPPRNQVESGQEKPESQALRTHKPVYFRCAGDYISTAVYKRDGLKSGNLIEGPALIEEHASTTVVQPGDTVRVDQFGNLQISIGSDRA